MRREALGRHRRAGSGRRAGGARDQGAVGRCAGRGRHGRDPGARRFRHVDDRAGRRRVRDTGRRDRGRRRGHDIVEPGSIRLQVDFTPYEVAGRPRPNVTSVGRRVVFVHRGAYARCDPAGPGVAQFRWARALPLAAAGAGRDVVSGHEVIVASRVAAPDVRRSAARERMDLPRCDALGRREPPRCSSARRVAGAPVWLGRRLWHIPPRGPRRRGRPAATRARARTRSRGGNGARLRTEENLERVARGRRSRAGRPGGRARELAWSRRASSSTDQAWRGARDATAHGVEAAVWQALRCAAYRPAGVRGRQLRGEHRRTRWVRLVRLASRSGCCWAPSAIHNLHALPTSYFATRRRHRRAGPVDERRRREVTAPYRVLQSLAETEGVGLSSSPTVPTGYSATCGRASPNPLLEQGPVGFPCRAGSGPSWRARRCGVRPRQGPGRSRSGRTRSTGLAEAARSTAKGTGRCRCSC
jgi:hypothetical protein